MRPRALGQWPFCRVCLHDSWGSAGEDKRETTVNVLCSASLPLQLLNTRNRSQGRLHNEAKRQNPEHGAKARGQTEDRALLGVKSRWGLKRGV